MIQTRCGGAFFFFSFFIYLFPPLTHTHTHTSPLTHPLALTFFKLCLTKRIPTTINQKQVRDLYETNQRQILSFQPFFFLVSILFFFFLPPLLSSSFFFTFFPSIYARIAFPKYKKYLNIYIHIFCTFFLIHL